MVYRIMKFNKIQICKHFKHLTRATYIWHNLQHTYFSTMFMWCHLIDVCSMRGATGEFSSSNSVLFLQGMWRPGDCNRYKWKIVISRTLFKIIYSKNQVLSSSTYMLFSLWLTFTKSTWLQMTMIGFLTLSESTYIADFEKFWVSFTKL